MTSAAEIEARRELIDSEVEVKRAVVGQIDRLSRVLPTTRTASRRVSLTGQCHTNWRQV
jgi:hypothetical protein